MAPAQLRREKTMISAPDVAWLEGAELRREAKTMIRIPQTMPRIPNTPPIPASMNVARAPMAATATPPITTKTPPINDRIYAAEGLSELIEFAGRTLLFNVDRGSAQEFR